VSAGAGAALFATRRAWKRRKASSSGTAGGRFASAIRGPVVVEERMVGRKPRSGYGEVMAENRGRGPSWKRPSAVMSGNGPRTGSIGIYGQREVIGQRVGMATEGA